MDFEKMDNFIKLDDAEDDQVLPGFRFHPTDEELVGFYLRRKVDKRPIRLELIKHIDIYKYDPWDLPNDLVLPGFRFHPTDEELVGFYLRRKVDKRPISLELIKHIDIYKYDPWDLPKGSNMGEKEWYFFCRRGRKYKNSIRPNRVTGSGFWKATGIDKPIYSEGHRDCIGLKKSLVYYRGSAGKGTKTDWMMHEFRLPPPDYHHNTTTKNNNDEFQEAEVWTLCRILKRNTSQRKCMAKWREISTSKRNNPTLDANSKTCSAESVDLQDYNISFTSTSPVQIRQNNEHKPAAIHFSNQVNELNQLAMTSISQAPSSVISSYSNFLSPEVSGFGQYWEWDELRSIMEFVNDPFLF